METIPSAALPLLPVVQSGRHPDNDDLRGVKGVMLGAAIGVSFWLVVGCVAVWWFG